MKEMPKRIMIHSKDIMMICGISQSSAWRLMKKIRDQYQKPKYAPVTVREFCEFTLVHPEDIRDFLQ